VIYGIFRLFRTLFCEFLWNRRKGFFSVSVTMHSARQRTIYAITRIIFPRTLTGGGGWGRGEGLRKTVQSRRKTIEVSGGGWVVLSRESRIVCREIVARWRIPDCERALLASGQKNRSEVAHAFSSVREDVWAFSYRTTLVSTHHLSFTAFFALSSCIYVRQGRNKACESVCWSCKICSDIRHRMQKLIKNILNYREKNNKSFVKWKSIKKNFCGWRREKEKTERWKERSWTCGRTYFKYLRIYLFCIS